MARPTLIVRKLRKGNQDRIKEALKETDDVRYRDRLRAVLWSHEALSVRKISDLLGKHPTTVLRWLQDYLRFGFKGLEVGKSPGRPHVIDADGQACLAEALARNPRDLGYRFNRWTRSTLAEHLSRSLHQHPCPVTVGRALHRFGYSYKRPKLSLKHRQNHRDVRRARKERDAALKKPAWNQSGMSSSSRTNASSI